MDKVYNVVLVAPQGLGKTMIAQNIASAAVLAGHSVLFTTAAQMLLDVGAQESARALDQRLRHYCTRTGPLVIDEIGYLSYDNRTPTCSSVVSRRYERKSVVITSNLAFAAWPAIFPNAACTTALIDRLVHHRDHQHRGRELPQARPSSPRRPPLPKDEKRR
jgi:DNA replication protein DnaC